MENPHSVSKLRTSSNSLSFNPCSYSFSVPPRMTVEADNNDEETDYFNALNCRPQLYKADVNRGIIQQLLVNLAETKSANDEIRNKDTAKMEEVNQNTQITAPQKIQETSEREIGSFSVAVTEEILCVSRNNKIEKFDLQGTVSVGYSQHKSSAVGRNASSDGKVSTTVILKDNDGVLSNIAGNSSFILFPVLPTSKKQSVKVVNIPADNQDKMSPILKYSAVSSFQQFYFKARSKLKTQLPNAKIMVQIVLNPVFRTLFEKIDTFHVQASLSCFSFDKNSKVVIRPSDNFNETTKILTWICSSLNIEKEPIINLEATIEGVTYSKEDYSKNVPETVPLIIKTKFLNTLLTSTKAYIEGQTNLFSTALQNSENVTQKSKVEFRFF